MAEHPVLTALAAATVIVNIDTLVAHLVGSPCIGQLHSRHGRYIAPDLQDAHEQLDRPRRRVRMCQRCAGTRKEAYDC